MATLEEGDGMQEEAIGVVEEEVTTRIGIIGIKTEGMETAIIKTGIMDHQDKAEGDIRIKTHNTGGIGEMATNQI